MRRSGWIWLLLVAVMGLYSGWRLHQGRALETDLLAMLPETERHPAAERGVRALAHAMGDRVLLMVGAPEPPRARAAARSLAEALRASQAFSNVVDQLPSMDPGLLPRFYAPFRVRLPDPGALLPPLERIQSRLASPTPGLPGLGPAEDPSGALQGFLQQLPLEGSRLELREGLLEVSAPEGLQVLVTATLPGSAFDPEVQRQCVGAIRAAEARLKVAFPEATVLRTGAVFHADTARSAAESEMKRLSGLSTILILALYLVVFRTPRHLALGTLCVVAGLTAATTVSLLVFDRLYLLTLVCGISVLGDAVDYSFLYFSHHLEAGEAWEPWGALAAIRKPLLQGMATTLLGYVALLVAPFPGLRQIAVFSMVGLTGAFLTVLLVLPALLTSPARPQPRLMGGLRALLQRAQGWAHSRRFRPGVGLAAVVLVVLAAQVQTEDAVQSLIRPSETLLAQEQRIRSLMGVSNPGLFFLVEGRDEGDVLAREEALRARLEPLLASGALDRVQGLSSFVPSPERQTQALAQRRAAWPELSKALRDLGFRPEVLAAEAQALDQAPPLTLADFWKSPFSLPFRLHDLGPSPQGRATLVLPQGTASRDQLQAAAADLPGVTFVDKAGSVSRLMARDRRLATGSLVGALVLVGALLGYWHGFRNAGWLLAPALAGIVAALAGCALLGMPLSLFAMLALFLVLGFGVDYAIFLRGCKLTDAAGTLGVLLAGASTFISYGLLAFSGTPALASFGLVLGLGVPAAVLASFLALRGTR